MPVVTITVNQWRIKSNAENGETQPVICVNEYEHVRVGRHRHPGGKTWRIWGEKIAPTRHYQAFAIPDGAFNIRVLHDPENKTPCGASCWMQFEYKETPE